MASNYDIQSNYIVIANPDTDISTTGMTISGSVLSLGRNDAETFSVDLATTMTTNSLFSAYTATTESVVTGGTYTSGLLTFTDSQASNFTVDVSALTASTLVITSASTFNENVDISGTTGISGATILGSTLTVQGISTFNNDVNITGDTGISGATAMGGDLTLISTDAGGGPAPSIYLRRDSASPAGSDQLGRIIFQGKDGGGNTETYGKIYGQIDDKSTTSEDGQIVFAVIKDGNNRILGKWDANRDGLWLDDNRNIIFGDGADLKLYHDGSNSNITNDTGALKIISVGSVNITGDTTISGNTTITGNLNIIGSATNITIESETLRIADNVIDLNSNITGATNIPTENGGINVMRGSGATASLYWDEVADKWTISGTSGGSAIITEVTFESANVWATGDTGTNSIEAKDHGTIVQSGGNYSVFFGQGHSAGTGNYMAIMGGLSGKTSADYAVVVGGSGNTASGIASFAQGRDATASGAYSHAEGHNTTASGNNSHAEGVTTIASGLYTHSEGIGTTASGDYSHAEGVGVVSSGDYSHAEGHNTVSSGIKSHAEGVSTTASGDFSHASGTGTTASGIASHAGGVDSEASGHTSFIHSTNSLITGTRSAVIGGQNITGTTDDTVYVPNFSVTGITNVSGATTLRSTVLIGNTKDWGYQSTRDLLQVGNVSNSDANKGGVIQLLRYDDTISDNFLGALKFIGSDGRTNLSNAPGGASIIGRSTGTWTSGPLNQPGYLEFLTAIGSAENSSAPIVRMTIDRYGAIVMEKGLTVSGNTIISGTTLISGATTLSSTLTVNNNVTITGNTYISGNTTMKGNNVLGTNGAGSTHTIYGSPTFTDAIQANHHLTVNGNTVLGNASSDTVTITGSLFLSGNTTLGNAASDTLTVAAVSTFNNNVTITGNTYITGNTKVDGKIHTGNNTVAGAQATAIGGNGNVASGARAAVIGGATNTASSNESVIIGGHNNTVSTAYSTIAGGITNTISVWAGFIGGSNDSIISTGSVRAGIVGAQTGVIKSASYHSFIGGGYKNTLTGARESAAIGGWKNAVTAARSVVIGGSSITATTADRVYMPSLEVTGATIIGGDTRIEGNLTIIGSATTVTFESEILRIADNAIDLNSNITGGTTIPTENGGINIMRGSGTTASLYWDEVADKWTISGTTSASALITESTSGVPVISNKNHVPTATTGSTTGTTGVIISGTPTNSSYVSIYVNGLKSSIGDAIKTKEFYFSADSGVTPKAISGITSSDTLYAGTGLTYSLDSGDLIDLAYVNADTTP